MQWVIQKKGTVLRWNVNTDGSLGQPYARDDCETQSRGYVSSATRAAPHRHSQWCMPNPWSWPTPASRLSQVAATPYYPPEPPPPSYQQEEGWGGAVLRGAGYIAGAVLGNNGYGGRMHTGSRYRTGGNYHHAGYHQQRRSIIGRHGNSLRRSGCSHSLKQKSRIPQVFISRNTLSGEVDVFYISTSPIFQSYEYNYYLSFIIPKGKMSVFTLIKLKKYYEKYKIKTKFLILSVVTLFVFLLVSVIHSDCFSRTW